MSFNGHHSPLLIPVVVGSVRKGRRSYRAARLLADRVAALGHEATVVDLKELDLPPYDDEDDNENHPGLASLRDAINTSDASIWLTPEYNHGYTAAIKNAIDHLGPELRRKAVAVCGLSSGQMGGSRAVEQLKLVMIEVHAVPIRDSVYFSNAGVLFDDDAATPHGDVVRRIDNVLSELTWFARALCRARIDQTEPSDVGG
jgi:NAD(P)H-dependent FMN reductase